MYWRFTFSPGSHTSFTPPSASVWAFVESTVECLLLWHPRFVHNHGPHDCIGYSLIKLVWHPDLWLIIEHSLSKKQFRRNWKWKSHYVLFMLNSINLSMNVSLKCILYRCCKSSLSTAEKMVKLVCIQLKMIHKWKFRISSGEPGTLLLHCHISRIKVYGKFFSP